MLEARRAGAFSARYDIMLDGRPLTRWDGSWWRSGGAFTLDGQRYEVSSNLWGSEFTLSDQAGGVVASAGKLGRRNWALLAGGRTYQFRRASWWRQQEDLVLDDRPVGSVRSTSVWRGTAQADLPGLALPAQVFALAIVLTMWDAQNSAAATI
jgi:hypothetical protein